MLTAAHDRAVEIGHVEREVPGTEIIGPGPHVVPLSWFQVFEQFNSMVAQQEYGRADPGTRNARHVGRESAVQCKTAIHHGAEGLNPERHRSIEGADCDSRMGNPEDERHGCKCRNDETPPEKSTAQKQIRPRIEGPTS